MSLRHSLSWEKLKSFFNQQRKIQSDILFESLAILTLSIASIIVYTYYSNTRTIINQAEHYVENSSTYLKTQIIQAMEETENIVNLYIPLLSDMDLNSPLDNPSFLSYINAMKSTLSSHKYITTVYFGTPEGYFLELSLPQIIAPYFLSLGSKLPDNTTSVLKIVDNQTALITHNDDALLSEVNEQWIYIIDDRTIMPPRMGEKTGFDPRKRIWYQEASKANALEWSDVYVFASTLRGEKGITASRSIYDSGGNFKGVFAADISLKSFSEFLAKLKVTTNSFSYVFEKKNQIIASSSLTSSTLGNGSSQESGQESENSNSESIPQGKSPLDANRRDISKPLLAKALEVYSNQKSKGTLVHFGFEGIDYMASFEDFPKFYKNEWKAAIICPLDDFVGEIRTNRNRTFLWSLLILIVGFTLAYRLAKRISHPIVILADEAQKIQDLNFSSKIVITSRIKEISDLSAAISTLKNTMQSFSYYIPKALVKNLLHRKQQIHVGGRLKEVTMMFTDIAGFTTVSENISPDKLLTYLSEYFEELTTIIIETDGTVDKYIGDAIMSFWGAPITDRHHIFHACRAALLCQQRLHELNRLWKRENRPVFHTRMGVHMGEVIIGNVGSSERMNYTAIGDNVNLSSRLEALNKYYGTKIIVSESVYNQEKGQFLFRPLDRVAVKGKNDSVKIYELVGQLKGDDALYPTEDQIAFCETFEKAYQIFLTRQWSDALNLFKKMALLHPHDLSIESYTKRCEEFLVTPPPLHWDGSNIMHEK